MTFSGVHPRNSERFIPKGRRKVLYKSLRQHLGEVFRKLAEQKESRIEEGHLQSDHVHIVWRQAYLPLALTRRFCYRARVVASLKMLPKVKAPRRAK